MISLLWIKLMSNLSCHCYHTAPPQTQGGLPNRSGSWRRALLSALDCNLSISTICKTTSFMDHKSTLWYFNDIYLLFAYGGSWGLTGIWWWWLCLCSFPPRCTKVAQNEAKIRHHPQFFLGCIEFERAPEQRGHPFIRTRFGFFLLLTHFHGIKNIVSTLGMPNGIFRRRTRRWKMKRKIPDFQSWLNLSEPPSAWAFQNVD